MTVLCAGAEDSGPGSAVREFKLSELLPESFGPAQLV